MADVYGANPRIALYGILGAYNYGTESIIRGTVVALRSLWPNCEITYVSPRPIDDSLRLEGSDLRIAARVFSRRGTPKWMASALLRRINLGWLLPPENLTWAAVSDCVLSIGGDLYTLPPKSMYSSKQRFYSPHLLDVGDQLMRRHKPFIIWGASIGPFEGWPAARKQFVYHLSRASLITARESLTIDYLASLGISNNVRSVADPAFLTPSLGYDLPRKAPHLPLLGINLSPHSANYALADKPLDTTIQVQAETLLRIAEYHNVELVLLPHVISEDPMDDDRRYQQRIYEILSALAPNRVSIISDDPGAQKMKGILQQCDAVIAARMHCGVHAASVGTPVLFLAYSAKARGMARYIYDGDETLCIDMESFGKAASWEKTEFLLRNRNELHEQLLKNQSRFVKDAIRSAEYTHELVQRRFSLA